MEVFLELKNLTFKKNILRHVQSNRKQEVCGVVLNNFNKLKYKPLKNVHPIKEFNFLIDKFDYNQLSINNILAIFHSHPLGLSEPSDSDMRESNNTGIPYYIYGGQDRTFSLFYPETYSPKPLLSRSFLPEFQDCVTLIKDFFAIELNISLSKDIKNWARRRHNKSNQDMLNYFNSLFYEIKKPEKVGDVIVFDIEKDRPMHLGVYNKSKKILHQPNDQLSQEVYLTPELSKKVYKIYRYKDL